MTQRIVLAGASGLIGVPLVRALRERGDEVHVLVRREPVDSYEHFWNPGDLQLDPSLLAGADAVISLNGTSVGKLPWTQARKAQLWESRIGPTRLLAHAIRSLKSEAPQRWLSGSAVGYYGSQPNVQLSEGSAAGDTFLARLTLAWEAEAEAASDTTDVALLRTAPVVHPLGVLKPMILLTKFGVGGPLGRGTQYWPWISLDDEVRGILHTLDQQMTGPVNLSGPTLATANDIGRALAAHLHRPFWLPAPEFALNLALSKDATQSLLVSDARVHPNALLQHGFVFSHETPGDAIRASLG